MRHPITGKMDTNNVQKMLDSAEKYYPYDIIDMPPRPRWTGNFAGGYDIRRPMPTKVPRAPNRRRCAPDSDDDDDSDNEATKPQLKTTVRKHEPAAKPDKSPGKNKKQAKFVTRKSDVNPHQPRNEALANRAQQNQVARNRNVTNKKEDYVLGPPGLPEPESASSPCRARKHMRPGNAGIDQAGSAGKIARRGRNRGRKTYRRVERQSEFLNKLPGEIRNQIYEYLVPQTRVLVCITKPEKERTKLQQTWQYEGVKVEHVRSRLYCLVDSNQLKAGFEITFGLLLACKQIRDEVNELLYARTVFCFDSMNVVDRFLNTVSKRGIKSIQNLEIHHGGYGEPKLTRDVVYKQRHDLKWQKICERIGNEMPSLKSLQLQVKLTDWPMSLVKGENWHKTLMTIVAHKQLHSVKIRLKHDMFADHKTLKASQKMENLMMSEAGKTERDLDETLAVLRQVKLEKEAERARRAELPPVQASKCLKIRIDQHVIAPKEPVRTAKTYTQSTACWEWKYGTGNILGEDPWVCKM